MLCSFSVRMLKYIYFFNLEIFFCLPKVEKTIPKSCIRYLWQLGVFIICSPDCPKQPRTSFPFYELFYPTISGRISDWIVKMHLIAMNLIIYLSFSCLFFSENSNCYRISLWSWTKNRNLGPPWASFETWLNSRCSNYSGYHIKTWIDGKVFEETIKEFWVFEAHF